MAGLTNIVLTVQRNVNVRTSASLSADIVQVMSPGTYEFGIYDDPSIVGDYLWISLYNRDGSYFGAMALGSQLDTSYFASYTLDTTVEEEDEDEPQTPTQPEWYENFLRTQVELAEGLIQGLEILSHFVGLYRSYYVELITDITEEE